ncbi:hypothetical protein [Photobacterium sp. GSS17]|uniref:hypothetical protein n=1 Tax=Photobacterium TaxID=657 RepID=UPI00235DC9B7|nr:hypothetical protein [Photobacterium sp. GSS17]
MRPTSFVRYSTPRSPSRLRSTFHAPTVKPKQPQTTLTAVPTASPVVNPMPASTEQAA